MRGFRQALQTRTMSMWEKGFAMTALTPVVEEHKEHVLISCSLKSRALSPSVECGFVHTSDTCFVLWEDENVVSDSSCSLLTNHSVHLSMKTPL